MRQFHELIVRKPRRHGIKQKTWERNIDEFGNEGPTLFIESPFVRKIKADAGYCGDDRHRTQGIEYCL